MGAASLNFTSLSVEFTSIVVLVRVDDALLTVIIKLRVFGRNKIDLAIWQASLCLRP